MLLYHGVRGGFGPELDPNSWSARTGQILFRGQHAWTSLTSPVIVVPNTTLEVASLSGDLR